MLESHALALIEALRGTAEDEVFSDRWGEAYRTVAIDTDEELRFERIQRRGRSEDGDRAAFQARNERERGWGLEVLMSGADDTITNDEDLSRFQAECTRWLEQILS